MQIKHPSRSPLRAVVTMCGRQTSGWGRPPQLRWSGLPRRYLRRSPARRGLVASTLKGATGGRTQSRWGQRPCRAYSTRSSSRRSGRRAGQIPERNGAVLGGGGVGKCGVRSGYPRVNAADREARQGTGPQPRVRRCPNTWRNPPQYPQNSRWWWAETLRLTAEQPECDYKLMLDSSSSKSAFSGRAL